MIEKFIEIKNIGRFRDCNPRGDVTFKKLTLLFAENGRGKTTFCSILRSLQTGQHEFIAERKSLGTVNPALVKIRLDGNVISFTNGQWSATHSDIAIFDSVFVHDNVYAGDYVDHEHKKNLYRVIIGTQGIQLAEQIKELDNKIRDANTEIRAKKDLVLLSVPKGTALEKFLDWKPIEGVELKIQQKNSEIVNRQYALEKTTEIQSKDMLARITMPTFPSDFLIMLSKQLTDIATDIDVRLRQQIKTHNMESHGETWLSQGVGFIVDDKCPFCGQGINGNDLIAAYLSYFNAAYKELKQEVAHLSRQVANARESLLKGLQKTVSSNLTLIEFWRQFTAISTPIFDFEDVSKKYTMLFEITSALVQQKQQNPTELVNPGKNFKVAFDEVTALGVSFEAYNAAVDGINKLINEQKTAVQQGADINAVRRELTELESNKKRFDPKVVNACKAYQITLSTKATLEEQKTSTKEQLDQYCEQIVKTYQSSINTYLDQFNAGFRITNSRHLYTGGTPSSQYQLEINSCTVDLGDSQTQRGTPCFKTALSSGDRSALALAFFLAALKQDHELKNKIVVFDDPFTSQDRFRRTCTQQLIRQLTGTAKQVIVLSHDPDFLRLIWEGYQFDIKVMQMCCANNNTIIGEWDIETETKSTYLKDYSTLLDFYRERKGIALNVARSIRPFIEGMLRVHFPGHFQPSEWLGDFIGKIRDADDTNGLSHAKVDLDEIEAINTYSKKYHHEQNPNADSENMSEDELHGFVKRTLRLVGGC